VIIDIPRSWKWNEALYTAIETIKDGLVYDPRYSAKMRNIRGVKVLCMSNTMPRVSALSEDRWDIIKEEGGGEPFIVTLGLSSPFRGKGFVLQDQRARMPAQEK